MSYAELHVAPKDQQVEACVALLRGGATLDLDSFDGMSCLDVAGPKGTTEQLLQILTMAEETNVRRRRCSVALHHAVEADQPNTIRDLVALGADAEYRRQDDSTNLHFAASLGAVRAAEALL